MAKNKRFYLSTAIPYTSSIPHIGNVYEIILADAVARFKRLDGYDVFFLTGTDEHGLKIQQNAKKQDLDPQAYVDVITDEIKRIYKRVDINYDNFIRTSDPAHKDAVKNIFERLHQNGDIYLGKYEGWYSIADESFLSENDIVDGKGPSGDAPVWMSEEVYFLKLSKYQERLVKHIEENPDFIQPESRRNEIVQMFLQDELPDLSITRTSFDWGVKVPFDPKHVVYVWIDALVNYITGLGYHPNEPVSNLFNEFWPADYHIIGKDVLRFHSIYWPIILMALELPLPKHIFAHPWILFDRNKMSKSQGNVIYTDDLVDFFGSDVVRYYVLHEIPFAQDGNITYELVIERNNDLTNTIGNLVQRTIGMAIKYREGKIVKSNLTENPFPLDLDKKALETLEKMRNAIDKMRVSESLEYVMQLAREANKFIDVSQPWNLYKENKAEELDYCLNTLVETIRFIAVLLQPYMPKKSEEILNIIKTEKRNFSSLNSFEFERDLELEMPEEKLFERFDIEIKMKEILEKLKK